jgi:hypothetical protein
LKNTNLTGTTANSRFSQLRILLKPVADFPLENLILAESTQFRSSQLTRSGGTSGCEKTSIFL